MTTKPLAHRHVFFVAVNDACLRGVVVQAPMLALRLYCTVRQFPAEII